jgi:biopolymer transport protein ExbB
MSDTTQVTSVLELLVKGGFIMIPIILLSFVSIYLFIEKFSYIRSASKSDPVNVSAIKKAATDSNSAREYKASGNSATERILLTGLSMSGKQGKDVEGIMESAANIEIAEMEKNLGYLGIIAGIAPMLGFIGTISGVIKIFYNISLADNISIGIIAGGLYQKMICSGAGLIVGVIAYSCYHYLQLMIDRYTITMQKDVNDFLKSL